MNSFIKLLGLGLAAGMTAGAANAQDILVTADIATSTTWTANNTYNLQDQIYVLPGATLTIEAGTIVSSDTGVGGSLAVSRGAQIMVMGTAGAPVVMTSKADEATWTGGDPTTGTWREAANEWGNLTLMGSGYISENATMGNTPAPNAANVAAMEGLVAAFPGDPKVLYGGGNDNDDSGTINYLSIRYGGRVIGLNNELNGLSLGGIGRGTEIDYVEIMNNVDDGIEIWGGTLDIKHFAIWNIGDDSFDVDQGWRGSAQFGLVVQGHSLDASQGSGVGDNAFETDGAEDSDWQPVTTTTIYNCTVIGQPVDGDGLTAWRDNARVQYRNCIFMDCGERVVRFDNLDGDGANGYGHNGTLSWADHWTTSYTQTSGVNAPGNPANFYQTQFSGNLCEITDSVFFRNLNTDAYTEANARGVFGGGNDNVLIPGFAVVDEPIEQIDRGSAVVKGGKTILPVTFLNPRPVGAAATAVNAAPANGQFLAANYRGAFHPTAPKWTNGWTASDAFGFTAPETLGSNYCTANPNTTGSPAFISASGSDVAANNNVTLTAAGMPANQFGIFITARTQGFIANAGGGSGNLCVGPANIGRYNANAGYSILNSGAGGSFSLALDLTNTPEGSGPVSIMAGDTFNFQAWYRDFAGTATNNFTDAVSITFN